MAGIVQDSPALISRHPRLPVELFHGPRSVQSCLVAVAVHLTGDQLVDVGEWLIEHGREHLDRRRP